MASASNPPGTRAASQGHLSTGGTDRPANVHFSSDRRGVNDFYPPDSRDTTTAPPPPKGRAMVAGLANLGYRTRSTTRFPATTTATPATVVGPQGNPSTAPEMASATTGVITPT